MPMHKVGTREEWSAERRELFEREQELGNFDEEFAKQRQELPWVAVEKEYVFDTEEGRRTLAELFVWKFFAEAPGWLQEWAENVGTDLVSGMAESPGWNVFALEDGAVYHTYSRTAPDRFLLAPYYSQLLDQIPDGRDADFPLRRHDEY